MKCTKCQTENQKDSNFCVNCGGLLVDEGIRISNLKNKRYAIAKDPALAAILSLISPGLALGQFYNGDVLKGVVMIVGMLILFIPTGGIAFIGIWIWSIIDAYQVAKGSQGLWKY